MSAWASPHRFPVLLGLLLAALLAAQCVFVAWVIIDRERLIRERDNARQAAERNYRAAAELEAGTRPIRNNPDAEARAAQAESRRAIAEERPGIENMILQHSLTK
jgi:hypothetical protein